MGDFPIKPVIKGGVGEKQSFFQGHRGMGEKQSLFQGRCVFFFVKRGHNNISIVVLSITACIV